MFACRLSALPLQAPGCCPNEWRSPVLFQGMYGRSGCLTICQCREVTSGLQPALEKQMRRREFLGLLPFAAGLPLAAAPPAGAQGTRVTGSIGREVNVKRDFGAKGDGVSDDWQAIENAGMFLEAHGG